MGDREPRVSGAGTVGGVLLTVLVPGADVEPAAAAVSEAGLQQRVRLLAYELDQPFDAAAAEAEVLIPPFLAGVQLLSRLAQLPRLRLVQLLTVGADPWLGRLPDGVLLSSCRGAHSDATAEWVLMAMLASYRALPGFLADGRSGQWRRQFTDGLFGKRVLVIGAGDVGRRLRQRLLACEATVTMVGRRGADGVHPVDELAALLPEHDAVVLVIPLTAQTRGLVDDAFLAAMPDGALLVNAARGEVVRTEALLAEVRSGRLLAALDVTDPEPLPADHPLWTTPGILITPHVAGSVHGAAPRAYRVAVAQLAAFLDGRMPDNLVSDGY